MIDFSGFPDPNPTKFSVVMDPEPPAFSCSSENVPRTNHAFLPFDHPAHYAWSPPSMGLLAGGRCDGTGVVSVVLRV